MSHESFETSREFLRERWARAVAQGRAEALATSVLEVLEARGLPVSDDQRATLLACTDPTTLEAWLERAVTVPGVDELFRTWLVPLRMMRIRGRPRRHGMLCVAGGLLASVVPACSQKDEPASDDAQLVDSTAASGDDTESTGSGQDCWQHTTKPECMAESSLCQFNPAVAAMLGGTEQCASIEDEVGWCSPGAWGGSTVGSAWREIASGRVFYFGVDPLQTPPGWECCDVPGFVGDGCAICECVGPMEGESTMESAGTDESGASTGSSSSA